MLLQLLLSCILSKSIARWYYPWLLCWQLLSKVSQVCPSLFPNVWLLPSKCHHLRPVQKACFLCAIVLPANYCISSYLLSSSSSSERSNFGHWWVFLINFSHLPRLWSSNSQLDICESSRRDDHDSCQECCRCSIFPETWRSNFEVLYTFSHWQWVLEWTEWIIPVPHVTAAKIK